MSNVRRQAASPAASAFAHSNSMDEIERIEYHRYGVLLSTGICAFVVLLVWGGSQWLLAAALAFALSLMVSGWYVARKLTSPFAWQLLEAEARMNGYSLSKWRVWLGNLVPGSLILAAVVYFNHGA